MSEADYVAGNPPFNGTDLMVVVSGCSGGGKSTLLAEMARRGYHVHPEPGRQIVKEQLHIDGDALPWENAVKFAELCVSRAMFFYNAERRHSFEEAEAEFASLSDRSVYLKGSHVDDIKELENGPDNRYTRELFGDSRRLRCHSAVKLLRQISPPSPRVAEKTLAG